MNWNSEYGLSLETCGREWLLVTPRSAIKKPFGGVRSWRPRGRRSASRARGILKRLGYVSKGHLVSVTRDDLVGQYVGHTAPKTREVLQRAMGGVLFIDEAYYLYRAENERDYGQEAIELLLQVMEDQRHELVVVLAGYRDRMDTFFSSNPGMSSRIAHHIDFPDYSRDELLEIAARMMTAQGYRFSEDAQVAFGEFLDRRMAMPRFANARSVRNALERTRLRHANRLVRGGGPISRDDLLRIEEADVRGSRVFTDVVPTEEVPPCPTN